MTFFQKEEDGRYRKFTETHYQRGYTLEEIQSLLQRAGLVFLEASDADTGGVVNAKSQRIYVTARESGKMEKQNGK